MRIFLAVAMALMATSMVSAQQVLPYQVRTDSTKSAMTYAQAFKKAQAGDKPLLVMVTAEWCPPCQVMKASTLPVLQQKGTFNGFHFAMMDYDSDPELADKLIGDRGLPQLIMYEKSNGKWLRRTINGKRGIHNVATVESFVAQVGTFRTASNKGQTNDKK